MRPLLLALLLATPALACPDAGVALPPTTWAYSAHLQVSEDGGTVFMPTPGGWLPELRLESEACELADLRVETKQLRQTPPLFSPASWLLAAAFGLAMAALAGYVAWMLRGSVDGR